MGAEEFVRTEQFVKQDLRTADAWNIIKESARAFGIQIQQPNPHCKKCHGRGYIGRRHDTGEPIACNCIFPKVEYDRDIGMEEQYIKPRNRAERRARNK